MQDRTPTHWIGSCRKVDVGRPECPVWIPDLDGCVLGHGMGQLQIEVIANAKVALLQRRIKGPPFEAHSLDINLLSPGPDRKPLHFWQRELAILRRKIPVFNPSRSRKLRGNQTDFQ